MNEFFFGYPAVMKVQYGMLLVHIRYFVAKLILANRCKQKLQIEHLIDTNHDAVI